MTKRILSVLLAMILLLSACNKSPAETANETSTTDQTVTDSNGTNNTEEPMRTLIVKDTEITSVNIQPGESAAEKYAGKELAKYLAKIGIPAGDGVVIDVCIDPSLPEEGYTIHPETGKITISGGDEHGVIYGVYGFLTHYAGMRFFTPELETLGEGDIIVNEEYELMPTFLHRRFDWELFRYDTDWCLKNGVNNPAHGTIPEELGGTYKYTFDGSDVTFQNMVGTDSAEQPCFSDPEVLDKVIKFVREYLTQNPDTNNVCIFQLDNDNYCKCAKCAAVDKEEGSPAGSILRFINAVADDIAEDYPDVMIETHAYWYSRTAPKITKPSPNVCIRLCTNDICWSHAIDDPDCELNAGFVEDVRAWTAICDNVYIWDYTVNFSHYIPPFPNFDVLWKNMNFFAENGARGMYPQGNHNSAQYGEFGELRAYLVAQLMMDPYMSEEQYYALMDAFLEAFYGEGWQNIRSFIDWICSAAAENHMGCHDVPFDIIPEDVYLAMEETIDGWWNEAEALAGNRQEYVHRTRTQWEYIKLMLHPDPDKGAELVKYLEAEQIRWNEYNTDWTRMFSDLLESEPHIDFDYSFRTHTTSPTPVGESSLVNLIGEDRIITYLPFDESVVSEAGTVTTKEGGTLEYTDGYFGKAAQFDNGYVTLKGWQPGMNSFSVAFWMKTEGVEIDPCILANKDWMSGNYLGFVFALNGRDIHYNAGIGGPVRMDAKYPLPADFSNGWVYVVLVVDREAGVVRLSYDFGAFEVAEMPAQVKENTLSTSFDVNIGQDGTGKIDLHLTAALDEYLIIDGVLTENDIAALKNHYIQ